MSRSHAASAQGAYDDNSGLYRLAQAIPAIQFTAVENDAPIGLITHLPAHSVVQVCGPGYGGETVKVKWNECFFYVFVLDLDA